MLTVFRVRMVRKKEGRRDQGSDMPNRMPFLIRIARMTYGRILKLNGVQLKNSCGADLNAGPYLILSNHVAILDPIMISVAMPQHIRWVAGAYLFKTWFLNLIIGKGCTAIPKQQGRQDITTLRRIQKALKDGDNVGLFPEGTRTWDGEMVSFDYHPLAKLLRLYKVPVLFVHLEGGFARHPRWAQKGRKGKVTVNFTSMLTPEQIVRMEVDDLAKTLEENLHFSNDQWKQGVDYEYRSPRRAEGLQRLLYLCPSCNSMDSLTTSGNRIVCSKCNSITILDDKDNLTSVSTPFTTLSEWHKWESGKISSMKEFPKERGVLLQKGDANDDGTLETLSSNITVQLKNDVIYVEKAGSDDSVLELPLEKVSSLVLNAKQTMELFCNDDLYRIRLLPDSCSLKYHEYFLSFKEK